MLSTIEIIRFQFDDWTTYKYKKHLSSLKNMFQYDVRKQILKHHKDEDTISSLIVCFTECIEMANLTESPIENLKSIGIIFYSTFFIVNYKSISNVFIIPVSLIKKLLKKHSCPLIKNMSSIPEEALSLAKNGWFIHAYGMNSDCQYLIHLAGKYRCFVESNKFNNSSVPTLSINPNTPIKNMPININNIHVNNLPNVSLNVINQLNSLKNNKIPIPSPINVTTTSSSATATSTSPSTTTASSPSITSTTIPPKAVVQTPPPMPAVEVNTQPVINASASSNSNEANNTESSNIKIEPDSNPTNPTNLPIPITSANSISANLINTNSLNPTTPINNNSVNNNLIVTPSPNISPIPNINGMNMIVTPSTNLGNNIFNFIPGTYNMPMNIHNINMMNMGNMNATNLMNHVDDDSLINKNLCENFNRTFGKNRLKTNSKNGKMFSYFYLPESLPNVPQMNPIPMAPSKAYIERELVYTLNRRESHNFPPLTTNKIWPLSNTEDIMNNS